tara:strand:- start:162 stop:527 length:366 start_codon:yes stop_codon:yes gene_type:complete
MNKKLSILLVIIFALSSCKKDNNNPTDNTSNTLIITTPGMYFEPSLLTCDIGDTIFFDLGITHNALEVSEENYNNNNASFLSDGFYFDFGETGYFVADESKTYYYVCAPHLPDMKGKIIVR